MRHIIQLYGKDVCTPDWQVEGTFDFCRFYWVKGGEAAYSDRNGVIPLNRYSLYVFPSNFHYAIRHNPDSPFDVLWFHVCLFDYATASPNEIVVEKGTLLYHLLQGLDYSMSHCSYMVEKLFDTLLDAVGPALRHIKATHPAIQRAIACMGENPGQVCSNKQLAGMLGYSEKYFIRLFTRCVGMQPHKYAVTVRMSNAAKHLLSGRSVQETADILGYSYAGNFSRDFKSCFHMSPGRYAETRCGP